MSDDGPDAPWNPDVSWRDNVAELIWELEDELGCPDCTGYVMLNPCHHPIVATWPHDWMTPWDVVVLHHRECETALTLNLNPWVDDAPVDHGITHFRITWDDPTVALMEHTTKAHG